MTRRRLTVVMTHPVQYFSPWFRHMVASDHLDVHVIYGTTPTDEQQGTGFGASFAWDLPLLDGYSHEVLHAPNAAHDVSAVRYFGVPARGIEDALAKSRPDAVLLMGWHAHLQDRALVWCARSGVPALYRGDNTRHAMAGGWRRPAAWARARLHLPRFAAWLAVGTRSREYLRYFGCEPTRIFSSPHFVDNAWFAERAAPFQERSRRREARQHAGLPPDATVVLFVGKLYGRKRPLDVVRAAAAAGPEYAVAYVGSGPLEAACRAEAARLGVPTVFAGFQNQSQLPAWYGLSDMLMLPSDPGETWGLVVNEAMACGVPAIVSDLVGCHPDMIRQDWTGAVVPAHDLHELTVAATRLTAAVADGRDVARACRTRAATHSMEHATQGLEAAVQAVTAPRGGRRVVLLAGHMSSLGGLERMAFAVTDVLHADGAPVHGIVNDWAAPESPVNGHPIVERLMASQGTWSVAPYYQPIRKSLRVGQMLPLLQEMLVDNWNLWRRAVALDATHVVAPEYMAITRHALALALLRLGGVQVIHRVANAMPDRVAHARLWRWIVAPLSDHIWPNSRAVAQSVTALGVPAARLRVLVNHLYRHVPAELPAPVRHRVVFVGQIIPEKGVDLAIEALALVRHAGIPATLDIIGRTAGWHSPDYGDYVPRMIARTEAEDLRGAVRWLGTREDVLACLATGSVHICPSRPSMLEGMPAVVIEAKAMGTPTLAFDHGPFPEMIDSPHTGWLVHDISAAALADALLVALTDEPSVRRDAVRMSAAPYSADRFEAAVRAALAVPHLRDA